MLMCHKEAWVNRGIHLQPGVLVGTESKVVYTQHNAHGIVRIQ